MSENNLPFKGKDVKIKLNYEQLTAVASLISKGIPICHATKANGMMARTHENYMVRGEQIWYDTYYNNIRQENLLTDQERLLMKYYEAISKARSQGVVHHMDNIDEHSKKHWQASAWILERTRPEEFALQSNVNVNKTVTHKLDTNLMRERIKELKTQRNIELNKDEYKEKK